MRFLLSLVLFLSSSSALAFNIDAEKIAKGIAWDQLVKKVVAEGSVSETGVSQIRSIAKVVEIEKGKSHVAYYCELSGRMTMSGEYIVEQGALTQETWTLKDDGKTWIVEQWFYYTKPSGDFNYSAHRVVEKEGITIHSLVDAPKGTIEEQKAGYQKLLDMWLLE